METQTKRKRGGQPVGEENFMRMINFRLKPVEIQMLKDEAARQGIPYSVLIRNAIEPIIKPDDDDMTYIVEE